MYTTSFIVAASSSRFTMKLRLNTYAQYENIDLCAETKFKRVSGVRVRAKKWPYRAPTYVLAVSHPGNDHDDSSHLPADSEQLLCFCQQPESGEMIMIACDHVQ